MRAYVDLYWLPLGAGGMSLVRLSGWCFEAIVARQQHREACALFHSALVVRLGEEYHVIEMAPVWSRRDPNRGVAVEGAVGMPVLGHSRLFRYEVRSWPNGLIPDIAEAVTSPQRLSEDVGQAERLLELVPAIPALTWGLDQLRTGEMWNSNSVISWLLARSGHQVEAVRLPPHGRAPGWDAGLELARRQLARLVGASA